jgi:hypothetical protein
MFSIKIGGLRFKVKEEVDMTTGDQKLDGDINYPEQVIRIERNNKVQIKDMVLLHEMMHGLFTLGVNREMGNDEVFIMVLSHQLYGMIRDNPKVFIDIAQRKFE